jgi:hypothetical protein
MALLVLGFVGATWGVVHQVRDSIKRDKKE